MGLSKRGLVEEPRRVECVPADAQTRVRRCPLACAETTRRDDSRAQHRLLIVSRSAGSVTCDQLCDQLCAHPVGRLAGGWWGVRVGRLRARGVRVTSP